ncbi:MAG: phosphomannomutase/phosphoglucomutase, partial [Clostridia bacterium]|nr:phosphomannomutase/phosphoglucomutase [Clostridia bacterium]
MDYMFLKSGTDVRGIASDLGGKSVQLTDTTVYDITSAFLVWLAKKTGKSSFTIAVGHDSRITADRISGVVKQALCAGGVNVLDCGLCSTPAMFMTTVDLSTDAAI